MSLQTADLNGDGVPDLIDCNGSECSVLLGQGDGTFAAPLPPAASAEAVLLLAAGDFDGDKRVDLLLTINTNGNFSTEILPGLGDGTFGPAKDIVPQINCAGCATGDFNRDGFLDIAAVDPIGGTVTIYQNDGTGTLRSATVISVVPQLSAVAAADVNGDGKLDLVLASYTTPDLYVLLGHGDGTFGDAIHSSSGTGSAGQDLIAIGDFNGDKIPDVAISGTIYPSKNADITVLKGNGDGTFSVSGQYITSFDVGALAIADVNGDGFPDLVGVASSIAVFLNQGNGIFGIENDFTCALSFEFIGTAAVADFNRDGLPDVAAADFAGVWVALNTSRPGASRNPVFTSLGVGNAASYAGQISAGGLAVLFGTNITSATGVVVAPGAPWPTTLAGTSLTVNGIPAPIYAVANVNGIQQINFQVPWELALDTDVPIVVTNGSRSSSAVSVQQVESVPGMFTADNVHPIALHASDYSLVIVSKPSAPGETIVFYATGLGRVQPAVATDTPASATDLSISLAQPDLTITTSEKMQGLNVLFSGLAPGYIGLWQINAVVPDDTPAGDWPLSIGSGADGNTLNLPVGHP